MCRSNCHTHPHYVTHIVIHTLTMSPILSYTPSLCHPYCHTHPHYVTHIVIHTLTMSPILSYTPLTTVSKIQLNSQHHKTAHIEGYMIHIHAYLIHCILTFTGDTLTSLEHNLDRIKYCCCRYGVITPISSHSHPH